MQFNRSKILFLLTKQENYIKKNRKLKKAIKN